MKLCVRAGKQQPGLSGGGKWKERGEKTRRRWRAAPRRAPLSSAQVQIRELWHDKESWQSSLSLFISKRTSLETEIRLITNHTSPSSFSSSSSSFCWWVNKHQCSFTLYYYFFFGVDLSPTWTRFYNLPLNGRQSVKSSRRKAKGNKKKKATLRVFLLLLLLFCVWKIDKYGGISIRRRARTQILKIWSRI